MTSSCKCPIKPSLELWIKRINGKVLRNMKTRGKCCMSVLVVVTVIQQATIYVCILYAFWLDCSFSEWYSSVWSTMKTNQTGARCKLNQNKKG